MLDAGRQNPQDNYSPRSTTPGDDVGNALASGLGIRAQVSTSDESVADPQAQPLGKVESAPLSTRLRDMMLHSDNIAAEAIAREVAEAQHQPATFEGAATATLDLLQSNGFDMQGAVLKDNSGMSRDNRLNAHILNSIMAEPKDRDIFDALPVAHGDGSLQTRFGAGSGADSAAGWVHAKTGTLDGVNALAGTVTSSSGRPYSFAFLSNGTNPDQARPALDRLAASLHNM